MADINYETKNLDQNTYKIFAGVYSDFRTAAISDYKFELEPLLYEDFIDAVERGLENCIVLFENDIPTAFLAYTTVISEAIELNVIHCLGTEDLLTKRKLLLEQFLKDTEEERKEKTVCYPMIGSQSQFVTDISNYGFNFVGLAVLRFFFGNEFDCKTILKNAELKPLEEGYTFDSWKNEYLEKSIEIVNKAFINSSDALFDPRFRTIEGTKDILTKISTGVYGEFLPEVVTILKYNDEVCGLCLVNITDGRIANIPIFAIAPEHQGKGLSKHLLKNSISTLATWVEDNKRDFSEINTTTETDNYPALKMYRSVGFKEDYYYPQSYLTANN